ncbi:MAG TPA: hypothetical protein VML01_01375 [Bryobacterales bacterium]|nr:hypothetical protein [Bryobacterales bacterium]
MFEVFDIDRYLSIGIDASIYLFLAVTATALFVIRLGLQFFFGDVDTDVHVDAHMDSTGAFELFSLLSVLAFFMGVGWMGLACRVSWGMGSALSAVSATAFGLSLMGLSSGLMYAVRQMAEEGRYDVNTAIGKIGKCYLTIPAKGEGQGQVEITVSGRLKVLPAISNGERIPAFQRVKIVAVEGEETFVVEPAS